jgi:hypothetical protein
MDQISFCILSWNTGWLVITGNYLVMLRSWTTADNTAFATLANMKEVGTRRKCPERYMTLWLSGLNLRGRENHAVIDD